MTLTIVDSSVLIDASRNREAAIRFLDAAAESGPIWSSVLVRAELWTGARERERAVIDRLFGRLLWQDVTVSIADLAGQFARRYLRSHHIGLADLVLAATAVELDGQVATLNVRDFPMFPDLRPPY